MSACVSKVFGGEMGNSFRMCVDSEYKKNLRYIRQLLKISLEAQFRARVQGTQECILDNASLEKEIKAGLTVDILPDGTKITKTASGTFFEKIINSRYALDEEELGALYEDIDRYFEEEVLGDSRILPHADKLLNWYTEFRLGPWKKSEYVCMDTIEQDVSDPEMLSRLKLGVCAKFFEALHDSLISRALSSHLPAKSEAGHKILIQSYKKHRSDLLKEVEKYKKLRNQVNRKLQDNFERF